MARNIGRREFIGATTGAAVAAPAVRIARGQASSSVSPSDEIGLGILGLGRQGIYNMQKFMEQPECKVRAVCDVYDPHLQKGKARSSAEGYKDFRRVLERDDIDVLVVSTPDHWHPLMTVMGCQAGKDVYVEKPASIAVVEGRKMVDAARNHKRVVQVGTQQRSGTHFQRAVQLVQAGELGRISAVRTWNFGNSTPAGIGNPSDCDPPSGLDWDLWLGPAPAVPFNPNRFGVFEDKWSHFRYFWDYAGGMMTDWGVHLLDIVQWAMRADAPEKISASGGKFILTDNRETPDTLTVTLQYRDFVCTYENRACNARRINDRGYGIEFYGTEGTLFLDRSGFQITPENQRQKDRTVARMYAMQEENRNDHGGDHVRDFLDCVTSRSTPVSDIEIGHRSTTTCLLGNIAYRTGRHIKWDATAETIIDDSEAAGWLEHNYRAPWKL